jgi:hypothetical protein
MDDLTGKVDSTGPPLGRLTADEFTQIPQELQNVITGILTASLTNLDLTQFAQAVVGYAGAGDFYTGGGSANAYTASALAGKQVIEDLSADTDGAMIRFRPAADNTGASTLDVNSIGALDIVREDLSALVGGELLTTRDAVVRYRHASTEWLLMDYSVPPASLTEVPRGYIDGLEISREGTEDVGVSIGVARSTNDTVTLRRTSGTFKTLGAAPWVEGAGNVGNFSGSNQAVDTWYHAYLIEKDSDGTVDMGFDTSATSPTVPAGWSNPRRIGSFLTNSTGSGEVVDFVQNGDLFYWTATPAQDVTDTTIAAGGNVTAAFTVPAGVRVTPILHVYNDITNGSIGLIQSPDINAGASDVPGPTPAIGNFGNELGANTRVHEVSDIVTNTSRQLHYAVDTGSSGQNTIHISVMGWYDLRGRNEAS